MTTSKKLLITTAGLLIAVLVTGLMLMRNVMEDVQTQDMTKIKFVNVPVEPFERLDISGDWQVTLRQGREYKVEWGSENDTITDSTIVNKDGVLYLKSIDNQKFIVKLIVPKLTQITTNGNTKIEMRQFILDTLNVQINDGGALIGKENQFKFVRYKTTGAVLLELTDLPME